jgi:putative copper resistance protein D
MYQLSTLLHVLSAIDWVGGMLFLALVVVPVARKLQPAERGVLVGAIGRRFRVVGWACIALLIVTGVVNTSYRGVTWDSIASGRFVASDFGRLLAVKVGLVVVMIVLSAVHDFAIGPASTRALERKDADAAREAAALRRKASWLGRLNAVLALVVVALAVALVRGLPWLP